MTVDLTYADYCWEDGRTAFRQRDPVVTARYDAAYLAERYVAIDDRVWALARRRVAVLSAFFAPMPPRGGPRLLDVGCGTNRLATVAEAQGWQAWGTDVVEGGAGPRVGWAEAERMGWDVVTFFDSLEHLVSPADCVRQLRPATVMVSVPECHRPDDPAWFMAWKHRRPGEHLHHWDRGALDRWFARLGYAPVMHGWFEDDYRGRYDPALPNILTAIYRR